MKKGFIKSVSAVLSVLMILSMVAIAAVPSSAANVGTLPTYTPGNYNDCRRIYFATPGIWVNRETKKINNAAGCYWWGGSDSPDSEDPDGHGWPGWKMEDQAYGIENLHSVYIPKDVPMCDFTNFIDGDIDTTAPLYKAAKQTVDVNLDYRERGYSPEFPAKWWDYMYAHYDENDPTVFEDFRDNYLGEYADNFRTDNGVGICCNIDNMIYVVNTDPGSFHYSYVYDPDGKISYDGGFYFYYGNGKYGIWPTFDIAVEQESLYYDNGLELTGDNCYRNQQGDLVRKYGGKEYVVYGDITGNYWQNGQEQGSGVMPETSQTIWFKVDHNILRNIKSMYVYIYRMDGEDITFKTGTGRTVNTATWGSKNLKMEQYDNDYWYFDLGVRGITLDPSVPYACIFNADWNAQANDILFAEPCFGKEHAAYCDGGMVENAVDSNKKAYTVEWTDVDRDKYSMPLTITGLGNVTGSAVPVGKTKYSIFIDFLANPYANGVFNAIMFNGKDMQHTIDDTAANPAFDLTRPEVKKAVEEANAKLEAEGNGKRVEWSFGKSTLRGGEVATPAITGFNSTAAGVVISWGKVADAYGYKVFYKNKAGSWTALGTTTATSYVDSVVKNGTSYTYTVRCVDEDGDYISDYDHTGKTYTYSYVAPDTNVATPVMTKTENTAEGVKLTWGKVAGASKYRVFYKNKNGSWVKLGDTAGTTFTDAIVSNGVTYTYTLRCIGADGKYNSSYNSKGWSHTYKQVNLATPKVTSIKSTAEGVSLSWGNVTGATAYRVFYKNKKGNWIKLGDTKDTSFVDTVVSYGVSYTYTVRCINASGRYCSGYNASGWSHTYNYQLATPVINQTANSPFGIHLFWNEVSGAYAYRVFYKNSRGGWTKLLDTKETSAIDEIVSYGKTYTYTVRCLNSAGKYCSGYDSKGATVTYTDASFTPQATLESTSEGVRISWGLAPAGGYRIFYKNRKGSWVKLADVDNNTATYLDTDVRKGGTYTYTVRALNTSGRYCSDYNHDGWTIKYNP